jgi:ubiquinone/menaquinone biosynthesis C-methylase UbiE
MTLESEHKNRHLGAFSNVDATDAADFIERLDQMAATENFRRYKSASFDLMRIAPGAHIADIGCGAGDDARHLAGVVGPDGKVFGIDISKAMIAEARNRFADCGNLEFVAASIEALPIATASLDAIRVDRVLIHVPETRPAIEELLRVLRPGGRIILCEPDMVGLWVASDDPEATQLITGAIAKSCVHPYLPRDIGILLSDMGLVEVEHGMTGMMSSDYAMLEVVLRFDLAAQAAAAAHPEMADRIRAWSDEQRRRVEYGRFSAGMSVMTASATKP